jgi:hypothetical protein
MSALRPRTGHVPTAMQLRYYSHHDAPIPDTLNLETPAAHRRPPPVSGWTQETPGPMLGPGVGVGWRTVVGAPRRTRTSPASFGSWHPLL